jgi:hypothetical protein
MTYSIRTVCTLMCVYLITKMGNVTQVCNPLGILDWRALISRKGMWMRMRLRMVVSQHVLEAIRAGNGARTGRALLRRIVESFYALEERGIDVEFRWVPGHAGVCGNTEADRAAREAASLDGVLTAPLARRIREAVGVIRLVENDRKSDLTLFDSESLPGKYTWKLDQALPGQHTLRLYGAFSSEQASILIQARTRYCRLNQYQSRIGIVEEAKCPCGTDDETVRHVLCVCLLWAI